METVVESNLLRLKIDHTDIFLEEFEIGQGKITISNIEGYNYSYFWGSMGQNTTLKQFLCKINSDYFAGKLLSGTNLHETISIKKTFTNLRKSIREDLGLPWYKHLEFQKQLREAINDFANEVTSSEHFVNAFDSFVDNIDFYLIEDNYDKREIESWFKNQSEVWSFISTEKSRQFIWLEKLHKKIKKELRKHD